MARSKKIFAIKMSSKMKTSSINKPIKKQIATKEKLFFLFKSFLLIINLANKTLASNKNNEKAPIKKLKTLEFK